MTVSFVIPLYNCLTLTQAMLESLGATIPRALRYEIILVDDGSTDGTREWLRTLPAPCRVLLNDKNLGFAGACNRGAAAARGEFIFFLNNDLVLLPRWLEPMLAAFARYRDAGLVGNVQLNASTGTVDHAGIFFNLKGKPEHLSSLPLLTRWLSLPSSRRVDALTGACFAIRRQHWHQLGAFDEGFINGSEDIDLCLRAQAHGLRSYIALRSVVKHHVSASPNRKLRDEQNSQRLCQRWRDTIAEKISHAWSCVYLATHWDEPRNFPDYRIASMAFLHLLHLRRSPPYAVKVWVQAALAAELTRWEQLFSDHSK